MKQIHSKNEKEKKTVKYGWLRRLIDLVSCIASCCRIEFFIEMPDILENLI